MEAVVKKATQKTSLEKQIQSSAAANPDINTNSFTKCKRPVVQDDFLCTKCYLAQLVAALADFEH